MNLFLFLLAPSRRFPIRYDHRPHLHDELGNAAAASYNYQSI
jgi:hypothetical protein